MCQGNEPCDVYSISMYILYPGGSSESLGAWDPQRAVKLYTNRARFPRWDAQLLGGQISQVAVQQVVVGVFGVAFVSI